jgi:lipoprotein-anchoring transpeptidase ErfK/SrfK
MSRLRVVLAAAAALVMSSSNPRALFAADAVVVPAVAAPAAAAVTPPAPTAPVAAPAPAPVSPPAPAIVTTAAAAPPAPPKPETTLLIDIDLTRQRMTLTGHGKVVGAWPISSGREGFRSPTGTFKPIWVSRMWYSKKYDNAPMPHAVFFSGGVAMHATQATGMLGRPASHGCIRQSPANAETTYKLVAKHGHAHTKIVVHGTPRDDEPRVARRDRQPSDVALATRYAPRTYAAAPIARPAMRRVIFVDGNGNRTIGEIPANDPRLAAYQRRVSQVAPGARFY